MLVMKFGGTSLVGPRGLRHAAEIVISETRPVLVVVSAMNDTTDRLLAAGTLAEADRADEVGTIVEELREQHQPKHGTVTLKESIDALFDELEAVLLGVRLLREQTPRSQALIASFGERLCAPLFAAELLALGAAAEAVDSRSIVITDGSAFPDSAGSSLSAARRTTTNRRASVPRISL